jgi:3-deoxy-manno-octulosonate cytidylyltransferase (CMP-KDO synthetase)
MTDENFGNAFRVVIPARYASTRFPGKALAMLDGKPLIRHVYDRACASGAAEVVIATDHRQIADEARNFGAEVVMTRTDHESGTDRIAEVAQSQGWANSSIVVNVQGDAPFITDRSINHVAEMLSSHDSASVATLCAALADSADVNDPNIVKVVFDAAGRALYFSRSPIPAVAHGGEPPGSFWWHIGIYAYRVDALLRLANSPPCELERAEKLEQLRAMFHGMEIRVGVAEDSPGPDINTPEDLATAQRFISGSRTK